MMPSFDYTVNGEKLSSSFQFLTGMDVVEAAVDNPNAYQVQSLQHGTVFGHEEEIDLTHDNQFILMLNTPTQVA